MLLRSLTLLFAQHWSQQENYPVHILMVCACSSCQTNTSISGNSSNSSKWFHWIPTIKPLIFLCDREWQNKFFLPKNQNKYKHQVVINHLTSRCISFDSDGEKNDSLPFPMSLLPNMDEQLPFTCGKIVKQKVEYSQFYQAVFKVRWQNHCIQHQTPSRIIAVAFLA